jgi:hypothetical protein
VELGHGDRRWIQEWHAGRGQPFDTRIEIGDAQGDVIHGASGSGRPAILDQLDPAIARLQEYELLGAECQASFDLQAEHACIKGERPLEIRDVNAGVVEAQAATSTSRTAMAFIS